MLIWVCALHCEAGPVIDYYRLKKSHEVRAFDVYHGDDMLCIVTGIGKLASAAACAWVAARCEREAALAWINLGVAGAAEHELGTLFVINKIVDAETGQSYYPAPAVTTSLAAEASGFIYSALRFSSAELTQSLKIISDNRRQQTGKNRQRVSELVQAQIESIDRQAAGLLRLKQQVAALEIPADSWQQLLSLAHFSQTQRNRLRVLWRYLGNREFESQALLRQLAAHNTASAIIATLEQISYRDSEEL
jgi:hypothetical protein